MKVKIKHIDHTGIEEEIYFDNVVGIDFFTSAVSNEDAYVIGIKIPKHGLFGLRELEGFFYKLLSKSKEIIKEAVLRNKAAQ